MTALQRILARPRPEVDDLAVLLALTAPDELQQLYAAAYAVKVRELGRKVHLRGLVEVSNVCSQDCLYCGIRRSNEALARYTIPAEEVLAAAAWAWQEGFGSVVLQSGERTDAAFIAYIEQLLDGTQALSGAGLGVTLSCGEQSEDTYRRWRRAGAHRYLLRIETTNPGLFAAIHPADQDLARRRACLDSLRRCGYQVGTGVMIGLHGQTAQDLAHDVVFMRDADVDMVGMGPFIPCEGTPLAESLGDFAARRADQLELGLKMIACVRLALPDINIAASTALQALAPDGRERGLLAGANILMPNVTDPRYRSAYQLYDGKPGLTDDSGQSRDKLVQVVAAVGEEVVYHERGDSLRFRRRKP
jgi:biotin synthase